MATIFLLQNQHKLLLNKQGEWCDGREAATLYRSVHHDEALNQMVEANSRDYTLRLKVLECETNDRGLPLLKDEDLPPLGSAGADLEADAEAATASDDSLAEASESEAVSENTQAELETEGDNATSETASAASLF
ncbi:MAG: hypothetical protein ACRBBW_07075 [Cellvibrionaceae bacterium]